MKQFLEGFQLLNREELLEVNGGYSSSAYGGSGSSSWSSAYSGSGSTSGSTGYGTSGSAPSDGGNKTPGGDNKPPKTGPGNPGTRPKGYDTDGSGGDPDAPVYPDLPEDDNYKNYKYSPNDPILRNDLEKRFGFDYQDDIALNGDANNTERLNNARAIDSVLKQEGVSYFFQTRSALLGNNQSYMITTMYVTYNGNIVNRLIDTNKDGVYDYIK